MKLNFLILSLACLFPTIVSAQPSVPRLKGAGTCLFYKDEGSMSENDEAIGALDIRKRPATGWFTFSGAYPGVVQLQQIQGPKCKPKSRCYQFHELNSKLWVDLDCVIVVGLNREAEFLKCSVTVTSAAPIGLPNMLYGKCSLPDSR